VTVLARGSKLGLTREATPGTFLPATVSIPWTKCTWETAYDPIRDESIRANDSVLQGQYQGAGMSTLDVELHAYPDVLGHFLRGMLGTDTVTGGATTTLSASTTAGATSITTPVSIPLGSTIRIVSTGGTDYATTGTPTGAGPYTIPIVTGMGAGGNSLLYAHASADPVTVAYTHTFTQATPSARPPAYSWTLDDLVAPIGLPGCQMSELGFKIDPKGTVTVNPKYTGFPETSQSTFSYAASQLDPLLGWEWTLTNAGGASTRGLSLDLTWKRAVEAIGSSDGTQSPREVFAGGLELSGTLKTIHEGTADMVAFTSNIQSPLVATLTKPLAKGGEKVVITATQGAVGKGSRDLGSTYTQASYDLDAVHNATDGGVSKVVLTNFVSAAY
jgi:hypothetical protein